MPMATWTSNEGTSITHVPADGCDDCKWAALYVKYQPAHHPNYPNWAPLEMVIEFVNWKIHHEGC